ncbi:hypothetical protein D3C86_1946710 [compost metagenome]
MIDMDIQNRRFRHRFGVVAARRLRHETLVGYHYLIFGIEKHILFLRRFIVDIVSPEHAVEDETQVFAHIFILIIKLPFPVSLSLPVRRRKFKRIGIDPRKLIERVIEDLCFGHDFAGE